MILLKVEDINTYIKKQKCVLEEEMTIFVYLKVALHKIKGKVP